MIFSAFVTVFSHAAYPERVNPYTTRLSAFRLIAESEPETKQMASGVDQKFDLLRVLRFNPNPAMLVYVVCWRIRLVWGID